MQRNEQFIASEEFYREALSSNPKAVTVYSKLIHLLISHANRDISDEVTDLLVQAEKAGVKDHVLSAVQSIL
jgi:flavorubredoxin